MAYSVSIRIKSDYFVSNRKCCVRKDGTAALYLLVIIEGERKKIPLEESWHPDLFDEATSKCRHSAGAALARHQNEAQCKDVNLICQNALSDAYQVISDFRIRRQALTLDDFLREFRTTLSKDDLVQYWTVKLEQRLATHEITKDTWKSQRTSLRRLKAFAAKQPFATMAGRGFAKKYDAYLHRAGYAATTRWCFHKDVKTYLELAKAEDNIWFPDPYANFANGASPKGQWESLIKRDLQLLDAYYRSLEVGDVRRQVLRRWLFALSSCGMRISDQRRIKEDWRMFDVLSFIPHKNLKSGRKLMVKLSRRSQQLWDEAVREKDANHPYIFTRMSGQKANEYLHEIERDLGIKQPIHNHIARHTFATQYLDEGGRIDVLQKLMNHAKIESTMVYVRTTQEAHEQAALLIDNMFGAAPLPAENEATKRVTPAKWFRK